MKYCYLFVLIDNYCLDNICITIAVITVVHLK